MSNSGWNPAPLAAQLVLVALFTAATLTLGACDRTEPTNAGGERQFTVRGAIRGIAPDGRTLEIEHEAIPNYRPAMTMPFTARNAADAKDLKIGDAVEFRMVVDDKEALIDQIRKIDAAQLNLPTPAASVRKAPAQASTRWRAGDMLPPFRLTNEKGEQIGSDTLRGRPYVLTFIFTRCPIPNFCPLMNKNFAELQNAIKSGDGKVAETKLLSISFDPEFDTPAVLKEAAQHENADPAIWSFATAPRPQIEQLTKGFSVMVQPEGGSISHGLATALVDANGRIVEIWRGNGWKPGDVLQKLGELSTAPQS